MGWFEVFINLSFSKVSSQLLCMVLVLLFILFNFAVQTQIWMIILFLIQFLREKWKNINIWSFLHLDNHIKSSLNIKSLNLKFYWFNWNQKLSDSVVYCCKGYFFCFECIFYQLISIDNLFVFHILKFLGFHVLPECFQNLNSASSLKTNNFSQTLIHLKSLGIKNLR